MKKILIALVIIMFIGGGVYYYSNQQKDIWRSYTSGSGGFEIAYPSTWNIEDTIDPFEFRIANSSQVKPESDQPRDMVLIVKTDVACKESVWEVGFGLAYWKTVCIPDSSLSITASAINEKSKIDVDAVLSTLKITDIVVSTPAKAFLETMKKDLNISSQITAKTGRMGLKDGTIANNVSGYELSYPPLGSKDNSYVFTKLKSDGLGLNTTELSQGYTNGTISCIYGTSRDSSARHIFCIDLERFKGEGPGADFRE